LKSRKEKESY